MINQFEGCLFAMRLQRTYDLTPFQAAILSLAIEQTALGHEFSTEAEAVQKFAWQLAVKQTLPLGKVGDLSFCRQVAADLGLETRNHVRPDNR